MIRPRCPDAPLTPEQRDLAESWHKFALAVAAKYARSYPGLRDELCGEAALALCRAAADFDPSLGIRFSSYFPRRLHGACLDLIRSHRPSGYRKSKAAWPTEHQLDDEAIAAVLPDGREPVGWEIESEDEVRAFFRPLGERGLALARKYLDASTPTFLAAARAAGLSESRLIQLHSEAVAIRRPELHATA